MTDIQYEAGFGIVPDSHYAAIGKVAAYWSKLEQLVDANLIGLCEVRHDVGIALAVQIPVIHRKLLVYVAIAELRQTDKKLICEINKFINTVTEISNRRNRIVHDDWIATDESGTLLRLQTTSDRTLVFDWKPMDTAEVEDIAGQIADCWMTFISLAQRVKGAAKPLPDTPAITAPLAIPARSNPVSPNRSKRKARPPASPG